MLAQKRGVTSTKKQKETWKKVVGKDSLESPFTVIVPIRNQTQLLPSVLKNLINVDIPLDTPAKFLFITNGCSDDTTSTIVENFLEKIGEVKKMSINDSHIMLSDKGLRLEYTLVQPPSGNISYIHLQTTTAGKANALNIGNSLSLSFGHRIALCIDSDSYPIPEAIKRLVGTAYAHICKSDKPAGVVSGRYIKLADKRTQLIKDLLPGELLPSSINKFTSKVKGALMAWDTTWIANEGGIPLTLREDAAMEVMAMFRGRDVITVNDAIALVYDVATIEDRKMQLIRQRAGGLQIMMRYPHLKPILQKISFYMKAWDEAEIELKKWASYNNLEKDFSFIKEAWSDIFRQSDELFSKSPELFAWSTRTTLL